MKTLHSLAHTASAVTALLALPLSALAAEAPGKGKEKEGRAEKRHEHPPMPHHSAHREEGFLGLMARDATPTLSAQLGLAAGFGLVVEEVAPESPAAKAGLKVHDVLTQLGDQKLVNMPQLQTLTRSMDPGTEVELTVVRRGKTEKLRATLSERPVGPASAHPMHDGPMAHLDRNAQHEGGMERREHLEKFMREHRERAADRMKAWQGKGEELRRQYEAHREQMEHKRSELKAPAAEKKAPESTAPPAPKVDKGEKATPDAPPQAEKKPLVEERKVTSLSSSSARVIRRDESGEYILSADGSQKVFSAKPKEGKGGEWPVNNDEQVAKVPEAYRAKLKELQNVKVEINGGAGKR